MRHGVRWSNELYRGNITDFDKAMSAVIDMIAQEVSIGASDDDELDAKITAEFGRYAKAAEDAQRIWREEYRSFMNGLNVCVVQRLRQRQIETGDDHYKMIADALDGDDYSGLAI